MSEKERPSYLPDLPLLYPRTEFVPPVVQASVSEPLTVTTDAEQPTALVGHTSPGAQEPQPPDANQSPAPTGKQAAAADKEARERARITLRGRVGAAPRLRTTPKQRLIAQFPLGVRGDDERTTWWPILAFDARAEQMRDHVKKGDVLEVIGYRHTRSIQCSYGTAREIDEVYATVIKPR